MDPTDVLALNNKAFTQALSGKIEEEYSLVYKAISSNPDNVHLQSTMVFILYNLGKYNDAKEYYDKSLKVDPNLIDILTEKELIAFNNVVNMTKRIQ